MKRVVVVLLVGLMFATACAPPPPPPPPDPPVGNGAIQIEQGRAAINRVAVELQLTIPTGATQVRIASGTNPTSATWQAVTATRAWQLPGGDGTKTVSAQFRRGASIGAVVSDTIQLDTVAPQITVLSHSPEEQVDLSDGAPIGIGGEVSDPGGSGVESVAVANGGPEAVNATITDGIWGAPLGASSSGRSVFTSTAFDVAGNSASAVTPLNLLIPPPDVTIVRPGVIDASPLASQVVSSTPSSTVFSGDQRPLLADRATLVMGESTALPYGLLRSIESVSWNPTTGQTTVATSDASILDVYAQFHEEPAPQLTPPALRAESDDDCENLRNNADAGTVIDLPQLGVSDFESIPKPAGNGWRKAKGSLEVDPRLAIGLFHSLEIEGGGLPSLRDGSHLKLGTMLCTDWELTGEQNIEEVIGDVWGGEFSILEGDYKAEFGIRNVDFGALAVAPEGCEIPLVDDIGGFPIPGPVPLEIYPAIGLNLCGSDTFVFDWTAGSQLSGSTSLGATLGFEKTDGDYKAVFDKSFDSDVESLRFYADAELKWEPHIGVGIGINVSPPGPDLPESKWTEWLELLEGVRAESEFGTVGLSVGPEFDVEWEGDRISPTAQRSSSRARYCAGVKGSLGVDLAFKIEVGLGPINADIDFELFSVDALEEELTPSCRTLWDLSQRQNVIEKDLPVGETGIPYTAELEASAPATWSLAPGSALPPGLGLAPNGAITGTPTTAGTYSFRASARFPTDIPASGTFSITITDPVPQPTPAAQISAGSVHTCGLTSAGGVKCWGSNSTGQIGDGTRVERSIPVNVTGLTSGVTAISAGSGHTCALTSAGGVKCWGYNSSGQIGDGTQWVNRLTPVNVAGLTSGVTAISAGSYHTCALTSAGGVKCWGSNILGGIGDGTQVDRLTPVNVTGLTSGVTAISTGWDHTCALTSAGGVKCWGYNPSGQIGDGTQVDRSIPVNVTGLTSGVTAISTGGGHTCALTSAGGVKCWGRNVGGRIGDGTQVDRLTPVNVTGLTSGVTAISTGWDHTCALTSAGGVKCWGKNSYGQIGDGTRVERLTPVNVTGLTSGVTAISAGTGHTCALTSAGGVKCWGYNIRGQIGDGTQVDRSIPVNVTGLTL
jgi:alpha-tubulin suppressor-like RCC1 family protein